MGVGDLVREGGRKEGDEGFTGCCSFSNRWMDTMQVDTYLGSVVRKG